jgi:all-trans-retinol 13,14-reductase
MNKSPYVQSLLTQSIEGSFDAIVIGSGIGGMTTAAWLAKHGKKVLVLEQHYSPGGYTHTFMRRGYEWDVGVHYIGDVHVPQTYTSKMFKAIASDRLQWADMGEVYDRMVFGNDIYDFYKGKKAFADHLKTRFSSAADQKAIDQYIGLLYDIQKDMTGFFAEKAMPAAISTLFGGWMRRKAMRYNKSTLEVLRSITSNPKLIAVLCGQYGDYGLPPSQSSFLMHAMLARHYMNGGSYPVGGSASIFNAIAPTVTEAGGAIFTHAAVKEIQLKNNRATAVLLENGQSVSAPIIVSSAGIYNTFKNLLPASWAEKHGLIAQSEAIPPSLSHVCLYLGIREAREKVPLPKANYWVFPDLYDHDLAVANYLRDPEQELPVTYISFPSSKDPNWDQRYPGRTTLEIVSMAPWEQWSKWSNTSWKKRPDEYEEAKEKLSTKMLEVLFRMEPSLRGRIDHAELSSPLSTKHFTRYQHGELYGLEHSPQRFNARFLKPSSPISGLYLSGQDVSTVGVAGAMAGGLLCASVILRKNLFAELRNS